ncbi:MAG: phosphoribosyltransferase family protein [Cyanobacteria bacterium P01_A01_bin.40]
MNAVFANRREAGKRLVQKLSLYANSSQALVLGLPRGGVPVAYEIAKHLNLPLDVCLVKKIGLPNQPEVAVGAISLRHDLTNAEDALIQNYGGDITVIDAGTADRNAVGQEEIRELAARVKAELQWRESCYRQYRPMIKAEGNIVIIVDDGMATGLTMYAAVTAVQRQKPQKIILAVPVALQQALHQFENLLDDIICLVAPKSLSAVGFWYEDFSQVSDQEVCDLLAQQTDRELVANS